MGRGRAMEGVSGAMPYPYPTNLRVIETLSRADRVERSYSTSGCAVVFAALTKNRPPPSGIRRGLSLMEFPCCPEKETETYFSEPLILVNWVLRFDPRPLTTAMMASAIPAAIRPYSIAVAPDSLEKKFNKVRFNTASFRFSGWNPLAASG